MQINVSQDSEIYTIILSGRWDAYSTTNIEQTCIELINKGMRHVIFDLAEVDYISSFGLRTLLNIGKLLDPLNGLIVVSSMRPNLRKLFIGSGFASLFPEFSNIKDAHNHLKNKIA